MEHEEGKAQSLCWKPVWTAHTEQAPAAPQISPPTEHQHLLNDVAPSNLRHK